MPVAFKHRPGFASADGGADDVLHRRKAQAAARDFRLVGRDLQHWQTGDLLDLDIGGAVNAPQDGGDLIGGPQQRCRTRRRRLSPRRHHARLP